MAFVGGLHRSGTSLVHRLIALHPDVSSFRSTGVPEDEGQHLQSVYPPARAFGGPGRFGFDRGAHMDETHRLVSAGNASRLVAEWSRHWRGGGAVLVEKSPPNLIRSRFLQALFPEARFVMVLRHPIAVALATRKWLPEMPLDRLIEHWVVCHEAFRVDSLHLRRLRTVRYEHVVSNTGSIIADIWAFLGLQGVPTSTADIDAASNERYLREWERCSARPLSGRRLRRAASRFEERVRAFGYSLRHWEETGGGPMPEPAPAEHIGTQTGRGEAAPSADTRGRANS